MWIEQLIKTADDIGILPDTDFFIVSDHGHLNIRRSIALNVKLAEAGLIDVAEDGSVRDWRAFCKSGGLSALVYLKDPDNKEDWKKTKEVLEALRDEEVYGISQVFTREEIREKEHLDGPFSFVVETDDYTSFSNDWQRPLVKVLDNKNYRFGRSTHGHLPDKGPQPTMFAFGPHIKPGAVLERANLVDEPVTIAKVLGIEMTGTDGRCLSELLK
jgi:Uncharacterized proteins of the AP superfamily